MRVSKEEKQRSRARILQAASRRFRAHGIASTGVAEIMNDAGMTHGGFYKHFADKDSLVRAALADAFESVLLPISKRSLQPDAMTFREAYLSQAHRDAPGVGCPIAALGGEIARSDGATRDVMTDGVEAWISLLSEGAVDTGQGRADAIRQLASLVGAIVIARAVGGPLSDEVLEALRDTH